MKPVLVGVALSLLAAAAGLSPLAGLAVKGAEAPEAYHALLEMLPATPEGAVQIWVNDYAAAAAALGVTRPGPGGTEDEVEEYLLALDEGGVPAGPFISGFHQYARAVLPGQRERAGYDVRDVLASIQDLALVPGRRAAILFDVSTGSVRSAILGSAAWPHPEEVEHHGAGLLVWDPVFAIDSERRLDAPVFDELGRAAPLAFLEKGVLSASSVEGTKAMVDAYLGMSSSLWDLEAIQTVAQTLARHGAYSSVVTNDTSSQSAAVLGMAGGPPGGQAQLPEWADVGEALRPYQVLGLGVGENLNGAYMAIVLFHSEEAAARENAALLPGRLRNGRSLVGNAPWSTWFDVGAIAIELNGATLCAKVPILPRTSASVWVRWFLQRDPLLLFR